MKGIDMATRKIMLRSFYKRYQKAKKHEKTKMLDEFITNTKHNRKYIIGQLNDPDLLKPKIKIKKERKYPYDCIQKPLETLWKIFDFPCGQRLKPLLEFETERLVKFKELNINPNQIELLKNISSATIDRRLEKKRQDKEHKRFCSTKPGFLLKSQIPIRLNDWKDCSIGFAEIDLVSHCGHNASGHFGHSLSFVDVASGWWEGQAVMGKSMIAVNDALDKIKNRLPFTLKGIDSDNGSEFINAHLFKYCQDNDIQFTRSRPGQKNDNAFVEQKNWTHVRQVIGYERYDTEEELQVINQLYLCELRLYKNFFQTTYKLEKKHWEGSKRERSYEKQLKTPYQRILESKDISEESKVKLKKIYENLNPADLKRRIDKALLRLNKINNNKNLPVKKVG